MDADVQFSSRGEYSDQHHLFPTNQNGANGPRSNHPLGKVVNVTSSFGEAKLGTNSSGETVYEPRDQHKGDAARALFYMVLRYNRVNGNMWDFNWLNTVRLPSLSEGSEDVNTLIQWCKQDPPDKWEIERNDYIQSIQGNRNPFIDHPEYINYINLNDVSKLNPVYADEPTNTVTNFMATDEGGSVKLDWSLPALGAQSPSGYLLMGFTKDNYYLPIDGLTYSDDSNFADGEIIENITDPNQTSFTISGTDSGRAYYFTLYHITVLHRK